MKNLLIILLLIPCIAHAQLSANQYKQVTAMLATATKPLVTDIATLKGQVATSQTSDAAKTTLINTLQTTIATQSTQIKALQDTLKSQASRLRRLVLVPSTGIDFIIRNDSAFIITNPLKK
jgi:hypothetical protein